MSMKISKPLMSETPKQWCLRNGLDSPEWSTYRELCATWALVISGIFFVLGMIAGYLL